jgi:hypothetical protein
MSVSDAKKRANAKFNENAYDRIELKIPKGQKERIKRHAAEHQPEIGAPGMAGHSPAGSVNSFIRRAIDETIKRDTHSDDKK